MAICDACLSGDPKYARMSRENEKGRSREEIIEGGRGGAGENVRGQRPLRSGRAEWGCPNGRICGQLHQARGRSASRQWPPARPPPSLWSDRPCAPRCRRRGWCQSRCDPLSPRPLNIVADADVSAEVAWRVRLNSGPLLFRCGNSEGQTGQCLPGSARTP
jgi:hypothetical protein